MCKQKLHQKEKKNCSFLAPVESILKPVVDSLYSTYSNRGSNNSRAPISLLVPVYRVLLYTHFSFSLSLFYIHMYVYTYICIGTYYTRAYQSAVHTDCIRMGIKKKTAMLFFLFYSYFFFFFFTTYPRPEEKKKEGVALQPPSLYIFRSSNSSCNIRIATFDKTFIYIKICNKQIKVKILLRILIYYYNHHLDIVFFFFIVYR